MYICAYYWAISFINFFVSFHNVCKDHLWQNKKASRSALLGLQYLRSQQYHIFSHTDISFKSCLAADRLLKELFLCRLWFCCGGNFCLTHTETYNQSMVNTSTAASHCGRASVGSDHSSAVPLWDQILQDKLRNWSCVIFVFYVCFCRSLHWLAVGSGWCSSSGSSTYNVHYLRLLSFLLGIPV